MASYNVGSTIYEIMNQKV